ncbi:MAG: metalloregulator ArsR/SmtB family transcription factor [Pseudanabaenaceae cyanobacterium bins.68]|nr:metalloregulator ArsR/SmtB family transcription factor [Pseudanabaenaceae cyanobacterium bins.68]
MVQVNQPKVQAGFHALADPLRLEIIHLLRHQELCVCDLSDRLAIAQSKLSFHLKILKQAGLLQSRQDRKWVYYRLDLTGFAELDHYLQAIAQVSSPVARDCSQL